MSRFLRLLRKDLEAIRWSLGIICGVIFGLQVFLRVKLTGGWPEDLVALLLLMPVMFLPFWLLWQSFQGLRSEWREDTVYTLLSLPVAGWQITFSKLVSVLVEYSVFLAVIIGGTLVLFRPLWQDFLAVFPTFWLLRNGLLLYLASLGQIAFFVVFIQLAFVLSKMVGRLQGLVALWVLFLTSWLVSRLSMILEPLFRWLAPIELQRVFQLDQMGWEIVWHWNLGLSVGKWLAVLALFFLTGYFLENYVEAN